MKLFLWVPGHSDVPGNVIPVVEPFARLVRTVLFNVVLLWCTLRWFDKHMHSIYLKCKLRWKAICKSSCKETITPQYYIKHTTKSRKYYSMAFLLLHIVINQQLKPRNNLFNCSPHQWIDVCDWICFNINLAVSTSTWLRVTYDMKSSSHKTRETSLSQYFWNLSKWKT